MAAVKLVSFALFVGTVAAAPWTIDLQDARRELFDKHGTNDLHYQGKIENSTDEFTVLYSNYNPNSQYSEVKYHPGYIAYDDKIDLEREGPDMAKYAEDYGYQGYMEKKVTKLVHNGSKYLEGLRAALEQYYRSLEDCDRMNFTLLNSTSFPLPLNLTSLPFTNLPASNSPATNSPNPPIVQNPAFSQNPFTQNLPSTQNLPLLQNQTEVFPQNSSLTFEKCKNLTERSEHIRRLAQLALHTTKQLQERVYTEKYDHPEDEYDLEDHALIVRLAFFLDKLAELTGYEAQVQDQEFTTEAPVPTTDIPPMPSLSVVPDDIKQAMMECLKNKQNSPDPATVRCNFPVTYPEFMRQFFDVSGPVADASPASSDVIPDVISITDEEYGKPDTEVDFSDISEIHEHDLKEEYRPIEAKIPKKDEKKVQKRSLPESGPLNNVLEYYAKYKAWDIVNPKTKNLQVETEILDQNNINKRSIGSEYEKYRIAYYPRKTMPRVPQDPMTKLDFYYKNKEGTDINRDPVQAAQVRAGLEAIFQNGNIEVVRRYGANYNPLVPVQLAYGVGLSLTDLYS